MALLLASLPAARAFGAVPFSSAPANAMSPDDSTGSKEAKPPQSTLDLRDAAAAIRLYVSIAYTGKADQDVAAMLEALQQGLADVARIGLAHGQDPELRALAKRAGEHAAAERAALATWKARHPG